ncbi:MAG: DUF1822 family protein [Nostoc sp.]
MTLTNAKDITISIPISQTERRTAQQFADEQPTPKKATQVYMNTLAVLVVRKYLEILDIPTELEASYSWNPVGRLCSDVADLKVTQIGHLECRPIPNCERTCYIPPDTWSDRIGYVLVLFDKTCLEATVLGFVPTVSQQLLTIEQLQPLEALLIRLHQKETRLVRLSQWFDNVFEAGWQTFAELLDNKNTDPALAFRTLSVRGVDLDDSKTLRQMVEQLYVSLNSTLENEDLTTALIHLLHTTQDQEVRWTAAELLWAIAPHHPAAGVRRVMDSGMQFAGHAIALMVAILPNKEQRVGVLLRLYPMGRERYLPTGLQLTGLDESGNVFLDTQARRRDDYIQIKFSAEFGERFSIRVSLDNTSLTENFII